MKRIQHGVSACESNALMEKLADLEICLDMCPISNYKLQVIDQWDDHPLGLFLKKGIRCTVSTDDPFSFNNSLEDEYLACVEKLKLSPDKLVGIAKNGFHVADIPLKEKEFYMREIDQAWKDFSSTDSSDNF